VRRGNRKGRETCEEEDKVRVGEIWGEILTGGSYTRKLVVA
jgi:hypothetical protein